MRLWLLFLVSSIGALHGMHEETKAQLIAASTNELMWLRDLRRQQENIAAALVIVTQNQEEMKKSLAAFQQEIINLRNDQTEIQKKLNVVQENLKNHTHNYEIFYCTQSSIRGGSTGTARIK